MKRSLYFILSAIYAFNIPSAHSLEIDEKLTLRLLKVSSTQKTVLINRGGEDGLVVGDHAKFFITAGVVARGVSEKVSPSRSVWSLYRIVDPSEIVQDKVLNLKIATPVKITEDPTKSLKAEAIPGGSDTIIVSTNEQTAPSDADKEELKQMGFDGDSEDVSTKTKNISKLPNEKDIKSISKTAGEAPVHLINFSKSWEVWGTLALNSLSGLREDETKSEESTPVSASSIDLAIGVEKYFLNEGNFLRDFSASAFIHKKTVDSGGYVKSKTDYLEYGLGGSYHFYNSAASINRLVGFAAGTVGKGVASLESKTKDGDESVEGSNTFYSIGIGAKYVLNNGFGIRGILDFYSSSEVFDFDNYKDKRKLAGPRVQFGLSYTS